MTKTLDLGCGRNPNNHFTATEVFGIDIQNFDNPNIKVADLVIEPIPFEDNFFDFVTGLQFLEHIPRIIYLEGKRKQPFIDLMSEVWRVLKPNGEAWFETPAIPFEAAFQDPQHVNYITTNSIQYFCIPSEVTNNHSDLDICQGYGFKGQFEALSHRWHEDISFSLIWHLRAIKD